MPKFAVIIPAAGKSERFEGAEKKTFAKLDGRPVFLRTLEKFVTRDDVCQTILAIAPEDFEMVKSKFGPNLGFMGVRLIEGGDHRVATVQAALAEVSDDVEYIAVHDAVRPCVTTEWINAVFAEAVKSGAAILASPVVATLKRVSAANIIEDTVSRESLYEAQTPQVFRKDLLIEAHKAIGDGDFSFTDDAMIVTQGGHAVSVVKSDITNLKVTTKGDVTLAAAIIKMRPHRPQQKMGAFEEAQW
ncbi:MAG: 2-C-methyl-D-erythritol 4-phosphate cytidylyltransferase [Planctomycetota bacterium]|jgi:2-C-methyl-D-erythritol 4-phosphate cytidylyltransferase